MRKYIIKNADGSEQTVMQAVHESREEAGRELMRYLSYHNENWDVDNYLSPFDFILEEVDSNVNEIITDFDKAREHLGLKPNSEFDVVKVRESTYATCIYDVKRLVTDINPKQIKALTALNELFTIAEAWNEEDEFEPNFSDWTQDKWYPWFKYSKDAAGFVFAESDSAPTFGIASFGSRLCFKTSERAEQFGKQFVDLYNEVFL